MSKKNAAARRSALARVKAKRPAYLDVPIALDTGVVDRLARLRTDLETARTRVELAELAARSKPDDAETAARVAQAGEGLTAAQDALDAFVDENPDAVMTFRVIAVGRPTFDALLVDHQPTAEERATAGEGATGDGLLWSPETFPRALVAEALFGETYVDDDGETQVDQFDDADALVAEMWDSGNWSPAETGALFTAAYALATQRKAVPDLGKASRSTRS